MTALEGADPSGILYYFRCVEDASHDSGWISEPRYTDCSALPDKKYSYTVRMKDLVGNTTAESEAKSATAPLADTSAPTVNGPAFSSPPRGVSDTAITMTAAKGNDADELVMYRFCRVGSDVTSGWSSSRTWTDTELSAGQSYSYTVQMQDGRGNTGKASEPVKAIARDDTPPTLRAGKRMQWDGEPIALLDSTVLMSIKLPTDPSNGNGDAKAGKTPEVWFECVEKPGINSGWISADNWTSPPMALGTHQFRFKLRDRSPQRNESGWSATSQCEVLTTNCYQNQTVAKLAQLPDSTLVRFTGTVTEVLSDHYVVADGGASISVRPRAFGHRTEPSYKGLKVTVSGHLWTYTGMPKQVTYAWVVPSQPTGRIECESGLLISKASPAYSPAASCQEAVSFWDSPDDAPNGVEFRNLAAAKQLTLIAAVPGDSSILDCYVNGTKMPEIKLNGTKSLDRYGATSVGLDIPAGATLRLQAKPGNSPPNLDYLVLGGTHVVAGKVAGFIRPSSKAPVRVFFSSANDPVTLPESISETDESGEFTIRLTPGKWVAAAATFDEVGNRCQISPRQEFTLGADRSDLAFAVSWLPGRNGRIEAESGRLLNAGRPLNDGRVLPCKDASGGYIVGDINSEGRGIEFSNVGTTRKVSIRYASPGDGTYGMYVNGKRVTGVRFQSSGGWEKFREVTADVDIPEHATVGFQMDPGDGAWNLDCIEVSN